MYSIDHKRIFNILAVHPIHARLFQAFFCGMNTFSSYTM